MGLRINTNVAALNAQRNLNSVSTRLEGNFSRLSSGLRIATAADDAAGLGISERMRANIRSLGVAGRNAQDGLSVTQTADSAIQDVSNNLSRMRELAVQSSNGTMTTNDRTTLDAEFQELLLEIDRVADQTTFKGLNLLDGSASSLAIQVGANAGETISIALQDVTTVILAIDTQDVTSLANATTALTAIDAAIDTVATSRGALGASQNRLNSAISTISNARENMSAAESRIRDVDVATETADLARNSILQQAAVSVLAQANTQPQLALRLLQ